MDKTQKEYYLNEQMKAIQKELGESTDTKDEISEIEEKLKKSIFLTGLMKSKVGSQKIKKYGANVCRSYCNKKLH